MDSIAPGGGHTLGYFKGRSPSIVSIFYNNITVLIKQSVTLFARSYKPTGKGYRIWRETAKEQTHERSTLKMLLQAQECLKKFSFFIKKENLVLCLT